MRMDGGGMEKGGIGRCEIPEHKAAVMRRYSI
jgi:hypothetical protein